MGKADIVEAPDVVEDVADGKQRTNYDKVDNEVAKYAGEAIVEIDAATNKRLKRMIDKRVLSVMAFTLLYAIAGQGSNVVCKIPIAKWLSFNIIMWGVTLSLEAACHNFVGLVIVRGFLGSSEAVFQPTFVLLTSMWYKREEQASTAIYWYMMNGHQQIIGGLLAFGFSFIPGSSPIRS
ncbi:major facilitator superfamily transporter [Colletotrichum salicis]|uniref:Major facilitator superfamily transporter n=1 Tax=Colletotrichum salicis TaxID=1209931 RepID=A0A135RYU9_9PEZI|nr:major facilitator superfamily transporter [Colletotrichum salicis]